LNKSKAQAWDFQEELVEKTLQWENTRDEILGAKINRKREEFKWWWVPYTLILDLPPLKISERVL